MGAFHSALCNNKNECDRFIGVSPLTIENGMIVVDRNALRFSAYHVHNNSPNAKTPI